MVFLFDPKEYSLRKTVECGQVFLYDLLSSGDGYHLVSGKNICTVKQPDEFGEVYLETSEGQAQYWEQYLRLSADGNYTEEFLAIMQSTSELRRVYEFSKGIRVLRQDPWETLVGFIISQRNNIPRIKKCMTSIRDSLGVPLTVNDTQFPTPDRILPLSLRQCNLGYRENYVYAAAHAVQSGEFPLSKLASDKEFASRNLMSELIRLQGVGVKVANCVALFGFGDTARFPVDVWIERAIARNIIPVNAAQVYGEHAGLVQQMVYYYMIKE